MLHAKPAKHAAPHSCFSFDNENDTGELDTRIFLVKYSYSLIYATDT